MNTQDELSKARAELASAQERLAKLEAQAKEEAANAAAPWEPKGGDFFFTHHGTVGEYHGALNTERLAGSFHPTREAAESALPYVTFFKRLCCLAAELNPSGRVGGKYIVVHDVVSGIWIPSCPFPQSVGNVFETQASAQKAADILNGDNWRVPSL